MFSVFYYCLSIRRGVVVFSCFTWRVVTCLCQRHQTTTTHWIIVCSLLCVGVVGLFSLFGLYSLAHLCVVMLCVVYRVLCYKHISLNHSTHYKYRSVTHGPNGEHAAKETSAGFHSSSRSSIGPRAQRTSQHRAVPSLAAVLLVLIQLQDQVRSRCNSECRIPGSLYCIC